MRALRLLADRARHAADRWLFRLGRPEPWPIVLYQRRIYVLPTAAGYAFGMALVVMLTASINYNLSLGYALTFLLAGVAVASIIHAFRNLLHLSILSIRADPVFCGDSMVFRVAVDNPRPTRRPALVLRTQAHNCTFTLAPQSITETAIAIPTRVRGPLAPGRTVLETRWPLGLIRAWSVFVPEYSALVYPQPEAAAPALPSHLDGDAHGQRSVGAGDDDFAGLRNYQNSDSPRHLAWKTLARGGPLMTKQFTALEGGDLMLDWNALPATLDDEARLSRLTAWILTAESLGLRYAMQLPGSYLPHSTGLPHRNQCLRTLALYGHASGAATHV